MRTMHAGVRQISSAETDDAIAVLTLAFADDPVTRWMYPTAQQHLACFPALIRAFAQSALDGGSGRMVAGTGVALWLPPPLHSDDAALSAVLNDDIPEEIREDAFSLFGQLDDHHPSEPYWYLPLIGVDPAARGTGQGSSLLQEATERADQEHIQIYLESTNPRNIPLYERHGFAVLNVVTAGKAPPMSPMLRPAQ